MEPTDLTIEILKDIRDDGRRTNEKLEELRLDTNGRLEELRTDLGGRIDGLADRMERVERRQTETEVRLATELVAATGAVREVRDLLREDRALQSRIDDHERRLAAVERRTG